MPKILYKELSYIVQGCIFEIKFQIIPKSKLFQMKSKVQK